MRRSLDRILAYNALGHCLQVYTAPPLFAVFLWANQAQAQQVRSRRAHKTLEGMVDAEQHVVRVVRTNFERFEIRIEVIDRVHGGKNVAKAMLHNVAQWPHHQLRAEFVSDGGEDAGFAMATERCDRSATRSFVSRTPFTDLLSRITGIHLRSEANFETTIVTMRW